MAKATQVLKAEYSVPYLAHAPMEPLNCTVRIGADKCEIWTGTQFQTLDQMVASKITGLKPEQVQIHTQFLGAVSAAGPTRPRTSSARRWRWPRLPPPR